MNAVDWSRLEQVQTLGGISPDEFHADIVPQHRPVILQGLVDDWPAVRRARESSAALQELLRSAAGSEPVETFVGPPEIQGRFFYRDDMRGFNFERVQITPEKLLQRLADHLDDQAPPGIYAGGAPVQKSFPGLLEQHPMPLLDAFPDRLVNAWLGNRTRTAAHWDLASNLACVVSGRRRFTLFPTDQVHNLYAGPPTFTPSGQAISLVDFHAIDDEKFPRFRTALEHAVVAHLEPGDVLFIPSMWWHHAESLDPFGFMVNYWWRNAPPYMFTPLITMFHALLTLRGLPEAELESWRTIFDHYIFERNGDPMEHLPEHVHGVFGDLNPSQVRSLKDYLAKSLR